MEIKPDFTREVSAGTRVYYIDARRDSKGESYVTITEIPKDNCPGNKPRQRVFVHSQNLEAFVKALTDVADHIKSDTNG